MKKITIFIISVLFISQFTYSQEVFFQTGHTHDILKVKFSPDDKQLVSYSAGDGRFCLWEVESGRLIWMSKTGFIRKANENTNLEEFYWSEDGKFIVTKSINGTYQTWDIKTGKILELSETKPSINLIQTQTKAEKVSNSGNLMAEGGRWGDASIKITNIQTGKIWFLDGHPSVVGGIAFSPDGSILAVSGSDKNIYFFDVKTKLLIKKFEGNNIPTKSISFSADSNFLIISSKEGQIKNLDIKSGKYLENNSFYKGIAGINNGEFSKDGKYFLLVNQGLGVVETKDWNNLHQFKTKEKYEEKSGIMITSYNYVPANCATFSSDGTQIISSHYDNSLRVWDIISEKQVKKFDIGDEAKFMVALDNQRILIVVSKSNKMKIKIINFQTGTEIKQFDDEKTSYIENLTLSPNGNYFITSNVVGEVLLWDITNSKPIRKFDIGFSGDDAISFSPDSKTFAVGGRNQNLYLFDVESGNKLWQLIPSYQPSELELKFEEIGKRGREEVSKRENEREKQAKLDIPILVPKITAKFSHYGMAESFWDQKIAETGIADKSKSKLPKSKASVAWFTLTNNSDLPISIDLNSMIFNPKCKGLCNEAEVSSRYVMELKNAEKNINGFDMYSIGLLPSNTTIYFSISLKDIKISKAIYLRYSFQKNNPDSKYSNDYGEEQKLYIDLNLPE
jgi:WD40 repeat protein